MNENLALDSVIPATLNKRTEMYFKHYPIAQIAIKITEKRFIQISILSQFQDN